MDTAKTVVAVALLSVLSHPMAISAASPPPKQTGKILFRGAIVEGATCRPQSTVQGKARHMTATCAAGRGAQRAPGEPVGAEVQVRMQELVPVDGRRRQLLTLTYR